MKNTHTLSQLLKENPELEVVPVINKDFYPNDDYYFLGSLGTARMDWMFKSNLFDEDEVYFKSEDEDVCFIRICDQLSLEKIDWSQEKIEEEATKIMSNIQWKKVIVLNIDSPTKL